jgi:hypothetical protein
MMKDGDNEPVTDYLSRLQPAEKGALIDSVTTALLALRLAARSLWPVAPRPMTVGQLRSYLNRSIQSMRAARDSLPS